MTSPVTLQWHRVAYGIEGAEGPCFDDSGRLFCVEPDRGRVLCLENAGRGTLVEHASTKGIPAGLALAPDGRIFVADMKRGLLAIHPHQPRRVDVLVDTFEGSAIRGCNDLCILDGSGDCFFTAPAGSWDQPVGELFLRRNDGGVARVDRGFQFCNGIAVHPDKSALIVAETRTRKLWRYLLNGTYHSRQLWSALPASADFGTINGPDGIEFSPCGHWLLATNWNLGAIELFRWPTGQHVYRIPTPFLRPSNLEFSPDGQTLWVTEHTGMGLWRAVWPPEKCSAITSLSSEAKS